jgi:hypothetical protein
MTYDELLAKLNSAPNADTCWKIAIIRAVLELTVNELDTENTPAEQVAWYTYGYNLAMTKVYETIEKELL